MTQDEVMTTHVARALTEIVPGAQFSVIDDPTDAEQYAKQVRWKSGELQQPTWQDVSAQIAQYATSERRTAVRTEAQRRMISLLGARDPEHLAILIENGSREAIRLIRRGAENWSTEQSARATGLEQMDVAIETIRAASNELEAEPPADFRDDKYWPTF